MPNPKGKKKSTMWFYPVTLDLINNNYKKDACRSRSEYVERAVEYQFSLKCASLYDSIERSTDDLCAPVKSIVSGGCRSCVAFFISSFFFAIKDIHFRQINDIYAAIARQKDKAESIKDIISQSEL